MSDIHASNAAGAAAASNRFGFELYRKVVAADRNSIVSPVSAAIALAMTATGARGETRAQMVRALHLDGMNDAHAAFGALIESLRVKGYADAAADANASVLRLANRLWAQKVGGIAPSGCQVRSDFAAFLRDAYRAPLGEADFAHSPEAARTQINEWASHETNGLIPALLSEGQIDETTRLVIASALYFKGQWTSAFDASQTLDGWFFGVKGKIATKIMQQLTALQYGEVDGVRLVELSYRGGLSMVVVLPDAPDGLAAAEQRMGAAYDGWIRSLHEEMVDLELPPWRVTSSLSLSDSLQALGVRLAFEPDRADFTGISDQPCFCVRLVLQKSFLEANEKGTEAAAVTVVVGDIPYKWSSEQPESRIKFFHVERPFLYFLRDPSTGAVLFVGHVVDPTE